MSDTVGRDAFVTLVEQHIGTPVRSVEEDVSHVHQRNSHVDVGGGLVKKEELIQKNIEDE